MKKELRYRVKADVYESDSIIMHRGPLIRTCARGRSVSLKRDCL